MNRIADGRNGVEALHSRRSIQFTDIPFPVGAGQRGLAVPVQETLRGTAALNGGEGFAGLGGAPVVKDGGGGS